MAQPPTRQPEHVSPEQEWDRGQGRPHLVSSTDTATSRHSCPMSGSWGAPDIRLVPARVDRPLLPGIAHELGNWQALSRSPSSPCRRPTTRQMWSHAARWSLMPRGIAPYYATSATPTSEPTSGLEKRVFRASAISGMTKPSRRWCVTGALTRWRRVEYVKRPGGGARRHRATGS